MTDVKLLPSERAFIWFSASKEQDYWQSLEKYHIRKIDDQRPEGPADA